MSPNCTLLSCRSGSCSATIREASYCSRWKLTQRSTKRQRKWETLEYSVFLKAVSSRLGEIYGDGGWKIVRPEMMCYNQESVCSRPTGLTHILLTETVAECTRPTQVQGRWHPRTEIGKWTPAPPTSCLQRILNSKGKISLLQYSRTEYITTL